MSPDSIKLDLQSPQRVTAKAALEALRGPVGALYIHVPFCFHKCHYCDFYSFVDSQDRQGPFVDCLIRELGLLHGYAGGASLQTIFVGGGTPSLLRPDLWERLLESMRGLFPLAPGGEFTVECNPETVTPELMAILAGGGVNRVSMGAQSFEMRHLKTLERWHDPTVVEKALRIVAEAGIARRSLDLIYAIPGQSLDEWESDLRTALSLAGGIGSDDGGIEHLSCYALTYEPNTAMTKRLGRGEFQPAPEELEVRMYERTVEILHEHGLQRYEVSNFARPGAACRHNMAYWRQDPWFAAGPSASAHIAAHRWKNVPRLTEWMDGVERSGGYSPVVDLELPDPARALSERLMTGLRLSEGIDGHEVLSKAETLGFRGALQSRVDLQMKQGMLISDEGRWYLTDRGYLFADGVASDLMSALI